MSRNEQSSFDNIENLKPVIQQGASDSAALDTFLNY